MDSLENTESDFKKIIAKRLVWYGIVAFSFGNAVLNVISVVLIIAALFIVGFLDVEEGFASKVAERNSAKRMLAFNASKAAEELSKLNKNTTLYIRVEAERKKKEIAVSEKAICDVEQAIQRCNILLYYGEQKIYTFYLSKWNKLFKL